MTWAPSRPLTAAEQRVDWAGHLAHITDRRAAVERGAGPAVKRLALAIADLRSIPKARAADVSKSLFKALEQTARFGYTEARREIKTMRAKQGEPVRAYAIPDIGLHSESAREGLAGISRLLASRSEYSAWVIGGAIEGAAAAARIAGASEAVVEQAALSAGARGLHLHALELVGETLNQGRTAGALSFESVPKFAMRSEQLDKSTCEACDRVHGEVVEMDSADYYALLPPSYCFGGGRCRGVMVFEDQIGNMKMPEPNPETKPGGKIKAPAKAPAKEKPRDIYSHFAKVDAPRGPVLDRFTSGVDAVLKGTGVKLDRLGTFSAAAKGNRGALANYYQRKVLAKAADGTSRIETVVGIGVRGTLLKTKTAFDRELAKNNEIFQAQKAAKIELAQHRLDDLTRPQQARDFAAAEIERLKATSRWSLPSDSPDGVFAAGAHEAGHALLFSDKTIRGEWIVLCRDIPRLDWYRVSEYAGSSGKADELFAEAMALRATKRRLPRSVAEALRKVGVK